MTGQWQTYIIELLALYVVRGFSFLFPNASKTLKDNFISSNNLLNIENGTEETANVLTSVDFFPEEKEIKEKIAEYKASQSNNL